MLILMRKERILLEIETVILLLEFKLILKYEVKIPT